MPASFTTNTSSFVTGILFDSADGATYDGSQDLIFITIINGSQVGSFGTYDYEVRIPSELGSLVGAVDSVSRIDQIE